MAPGRVEVVVHAGAERIEHGGVRLGVGPGRGTAGQRVEAADRAGGLLQPLLADLHRRAVVGLQQHHAVRARIDLLDEVEQVLEVAEALRHLLAAGVDHEAVVHPVVGEALAERHGLGPLVLVVRELQVQPAAVQVEPLAQQLERHHHALGVPARATVAPRRRPRRLARLGQLPQREVGAGRACTSAPNTSRSPPPVEHVVEGLVGEQAVVLDGAHAEVHAVVGGVGAADVDQLADHRHHLLDVVGGVGNVGGTGDADAVHRPPPHRLALGARSRASHAARRRPA